MCQQVVVAVDRDESIWGRGQKQLVANSTKDVRYAFEVRLSSNMRSSI